MLWDKLLLPVSLVAAYFVLLKFLKKPRTAELVLLKEHEVESLSNAAQEQKSIVIEPVPIEEKSTPEEKVPTDEDIQKYVVLAEECEPQLTKSLQKDYFAKLEVEYSQIKRALDRCAALGDGDHVSYALRIIDFGLLLEGNTKDIVSASNLIFFDSYVKTYECSSINAKFFQAIGFLAHAKGAFEEAEEHLTVSLSYHTTLGNDFASATVANQLGICARERGEYNRAESLHQTALEIFNKVHSPWGITQAQNNLGVVAREKGEWETAKTLFEESLQTRKMIGDKIGIASSYGNLGAVAYAQGDYASAAYYHAKCLKIRRKINDVWGVTGATANIGLVAIELNELVKARESLSEAMRSFAKLQDQLGMCEALEAFGCLEAKEQKWQRASVLFGASTQLRSTIRVHVPLSRKGHHEKYIKEIGQNLTAETVNRLFEQGGKMEFTQAVAYALV